MSRMPRRLLFALGALALLAVLIAAWSYRAPVVAATTVREAPLVRTLQFSARVATASRVDIGSTLTGRVAQVDVTEGAQVKAGDVLVRLESDELRAALQQAQASERQAAARLAGLRSTGRSTAEAAVAQADSVLVAVQADLKRTQDLVAQGFVSEARLDEARRAVAVASAQLTSARAQSQANTERGTEVAQAEAQVALARSAADVASARLAQTVMTAPADARVLARAVEPGQIVQPGRALVTLALDSPLQLVAPVDERYLEQLQIGQTASVLADAFPGQPFPAVVQSIAPLVDAQRGAIEVKFSLPQAPPPFLREDMTLSIEVLTASRDKALIVPVDALGADASPSVATVRVARDGRVALQNVRLGLRTMAAAEVLEGLAVGDVVLLGATPAPGQRVRADIVAEGAAATAAGPKVRKAQGEDAGAAMSNAMGR